MSTRLKHKINCVDCDAERLVTKACLKLVTRCKPCQKVFNRDRARNRYREIKGIPLDKPVTSPIKKKEPPAKMASPEPVVAEEKVKKVEPARTPEEIERRRKALDKLFEMLGDGSTVDDW